VARPAPRTARSGASALTEPARSSLRNVAAECLERIDDAYAAMDERRAIKSLVRVGAI
jgi:hypothetical protein